MHNSPPNVANGSPGKIEKRCDAECLKKYDQN
jgi:hypothetical protein